MFKNILLPTDGSELSKRAIAKGLQLAKEVGAKVTGLSAVLPSRQPVGVGVSILGEHVVEAAADDFLQSLIHEANAAGVEIECFSVVASSVHEAIVETAEKLNCDLICMGTHGRSYLGKVWHGSEVASVLADCQVPVLVVR